MGYITVVQDHNHIVGLSFKKSRFDETSALIEKTFQQLEEYFSGSRKEFTIPVDPAGTTFQKKVWEAISRIPYGTVTTYGEIAEDIGRDNSYRAVGSACADNPVLILVPCHRVIRSDGGLGGYAGGLNTKIKLLHLEYEQSE